MQASRPWLAVVLLAALASGAGPAAAVADDALLAMVSILAYAGSDDPPREGMLQVQVEPTDDAPDGPMAGRVEFLVEDLDGLREPRRLTAGFTIEVGSPSPLGGDVWNVATAWTPEGPGLYNVSATLWKDGAESPWDTRWTWQAVGRSPGLGTGWGHARFAPAPEHDLDGDGTTDLWLSDNATGEPLSRSLDAYESVRMATGLAEWSRQCGRGLSLEFGGESDAVTDVRLRAAAIENLVPGASPLEAGTQGAAPPVPHDGFYEVSLGAHYYGTRSDYVMFTRTCAAPASLPHTWSDGYRTFANVTHWDLDADGQMDVLFWRTTATSAAEARNQTLEERRSEQVTLVSGIRVERRDTVRRATFEMRPLGDGHEGAWVEIQDADRLFRTLLEPAGNATLAYSISLPPEDSFVEANGTTTWAWIGHFSTQSLTVEYRDGPAPPGEASTEPGSEPSGQGSPSSGSAPSGSPEGNGIPGPGLALAALAVVVAVLALRRR